MILLLACASTTAPPDDCDPRVLEAGEVRAKQVACSDELVAGGEGRVGDWLVENAVARFVVRGSYGSLTQLGGAGGTLVDAASPGGLDLLVELVTEGTAGEVRGATHDDSAEVRAGDVVYRLEADSGYLQVESGSGDGLLVPHPAAARAGLAMRRDGAFLGVDAEPVTDDDGSAPGAPGQLALSALRGLALSPDGLWTEAVTIQSPGASAVAARVDGLLVDRVPLVGGEAQTYLPAGAALTGEAPGCRFDGLALEGCAGLTVEAVDDAGRPIPVSVHFDGADYPLPEGGGRAPLGLGAGPAWVWAGPGHAAWRGTYTGHDSRVALTLPRVMPPAAAWPSPGATFATGGLVLAHLAAEAGPDADHGTFSRDLVHRFRAEGVGLVAAVADAEIPLAERDPHDDAVLLAASRAGGDTWAWPFSSTTRRSGHGAVDAHGFGALDRVALTRGGGSADRYTVVTPEWVDEARGEAPPHAWSPLPDALYLADATALPTWEALLDDWVDVAPLGPRTWVRYLGAPGATAYEAGLRNRELSAGNGPFVTLARAATTEGDPVDDLVRVQVAAPGWMGTPTLRLLTDLGQTALPWPSGGEIVVPAPEGAWLVARVDTACANPWCSEAGWAVTPALWLRPPYSM